jgi:hypothetical protein
VIVLAKPFTPEQIRRALATTTGARPKPPPPAREPGPEREALAVSKR